MAGTIRQQTDLSNKPSGTNERAREAKHSAPALQQYGAALALVAAALVLTLVLRPLFPYPFFFLFFAAVMGAGWFGGMAPGLFSVLLSTLAVDYFLLPPFHSLTINTRDAAYFAAFVLCSLAASWVSSLKKKREVTLLEDRVKLEARVAEHSAELHRSQTELLESERGLQVLAEDIPRKLWSAAEAESGTLAAAPLAEVLSRVVEFAVSLVKCDSCFIYVLEDDALVLRASKNPHPESVDQLKVQMGEGITGWVAEHREPVAVAQNAAEDPRFRVFNELIEERYQAFLSVPILSRGRLVGVINLQNREPHQYSEREIRLLSTIGFLVGAEIEMARLESERTQLSQKLADRKIIDRAKGILQREFKLSEEDAYLTLQRESRRRGKAMKEIAESILLNDEIRHGKPKQN